MARKRAASQGQVDGVLIRGRPAARVGSGTAHGGAVAGPGFPSVPIGG